MKNGNPLVKHHFWLLILFVPMFVMIGVFGVSCSVSELQAKKDKDIADAKSKISGVNNKLRESSLLSEPAIKKIDKELDKIGGTQTDLWTTNWEQQQNSTWGPRNTLGKRERLFSWPQQTKMLRVLGEQNLKFGSDFTGTQLSAMTADFQVPESYLYEYSSVKPDGTGGGLGMVDKVAPTQFKDGWKSVLRYVDFFGGADLNKDQVWLVLEDLWVQRSLLEAVRSVNEDMATFHRARFDDKTKTYVDDPSYVDGNKVDSRGNIVPTPASEKLKGVFTNRTWAVELAVVPDGKGYRLTGTLINNTDRLQLMGSGNVMTLHVWLGKGDTVQPMTFKIGGEYVPGRGATKVVNGKEVPDNVRPIIPTEAHIITGIVPAEIARVEQVFDIRTVPVKRIDALRLGFKDSRNAKAELVPPRFITAKTEPATTTPGGMPPMGSGPMGPTPPMGVSIGGPGGPGGMGQGTPGGAGSAGQYGGGSLETVIDGNKKRYLVVTDQVRRMPVGIVVIVDQALIEDVLLAFANSSLRFQITQVTITHFRGTLDGLNDSSSGGTGQTGNIVGSGPGKLGEGFDGPVPGGPRPPRGPRPGGPTPPSFSPPMSPGGMGPGGNYPYGSGPATVSSSQVTAGLVELSIYGIVSIYEKYQPPKTEAKTEGTGTPGTPAPTPDPKTPAPAPMTPNTPAPKMRRRVQR